MIKIGHRPQRSLARSVEVSGRGFVTGANITIRFCPAAIDSGIAFQRVDLNDVEPIPARVDAVTGTNRRTTLGVQPNQVTLIEHAMAALAGMRIDNCLVEIDGPEPPGMDGSSLGFVEAIASGGIILHTAHRSLWTVKEPVLLRSGGATLSFYPTANDDLFVSYILDFGPNSPIAPQTHTEAIAPDRFLRNISRCRTFLLEQEAIELQRQGIGRHLAAGELLVFGASGPIKNRLRYPNEPARHKILDIVGDLALSGHDLAGHIVGYRSGHPLNVEMAKILCEMAGANRSQCSVRRAA